MKRNEILSEISLGNYREKAAKSKASTQMKGIFGPENPDNDRVIANRERGLLRAKRRSEKKAAPPALVDREALTAKLDQLKSQFDPHYDRSDDYSYWNKQKSISDQIRSITQQLGKLSEMTPTGPPQPGKVQKVNPDGTADVVDAKGTVTKIDQKAIAPDANDPNKLTANVPKPKLAPGTAISMVSEGIESLKRLAGL